MLWVETDFGYQWHLPYHWWTVDLPLGILMKSCRIILLSQLAYHVFRLRLQILSPPPKFISVSGGRIFNKSTFSALAIASSLMLEYLSLVSWKFLSHKRFTWMMKSLKCFMACSFTLNQPLPLGFYFKTLMQIQSDKNGFKMISSIWRLANNDRLIKYCTVSEGEHSLTL